MPNVTLPIDESYHSILRPTVTDIVRSIIEFTGLPKNFPIAYPGLTGSIANAGSTINDVAMTPAFEGNDQCYIEVNEVIKEERLLSNTGRNPMNSRIVYDPALEIEMQPLYAVTDVTISVRCNLQSRTAARKWIEQFKYKASQGRAESFHVVNYTYPIPLEFLMILNHLAVLKEQQAGYNETLKEYFQRVMSPKRRVISNLNGAQKEIVMTERQVGILGAFSFMASPEAPEKNNEHGGVTVGFDYTFTYDKVTGVNFKYPIMVHNQLIDPRFINFDTAYKLESHKRYGSYDRSLLSGFETSNLVKHQLMDGIPIPAYDEWVPAKLPRGTNSVMRVLLSFNAQYPVEMFSLKEIPDYKFTDIIMQYMVSEGSRMKKLGESLFYISVFKNEKQLTADQFMVDADLNLTLVSPASLRATYHARISVVTDLSILSTDARTRLRDNKAVLIEVIKSIFDSKTSDKVTKVLEDLKRITERDLNTINDSISYNVTKWDTGLEKRFLTVGSYIVIPHGA